MILLIAPLLLLLAAVVPAASAGATACSVPAVDTRCASTTCPAPEVVPASGSTPVKLKCSAAHWFINGADYIAGTEQFVCKEGNWHRGIYVVTSALCVPTMMCFLTGGVDTTSILRLHQPQMTEKTLSCQKPAKAAVHIFWPKATRPEIQTGELSCDTTSALWKTATGKPLPKGTKVFCQVPSDDVDAELVEQERLNDEDNDIIYEEEEAAQIWLLPITTFIGAILVVVISVPTAYAARKFLPRKRIVLQEPIPKEVWSEEWEVEDENIEWNWDIVKEFIANWDNHTIEDRARFIDEGYLMLGYQSTITQMLYIFEAMLMVENHHVVWAPMINFLCRVSRLVRPPHTSVDVCNKFNTWLSYQGRKLIEEFGYHADDPVMSDCTDSCCSASHCYSAIDSASETEADKKRKAEEQAKKLRKKRKKKDREGAGAEDKPAEGKNEGAKSKPSEPTPSSNPSGDSGHPTSSGKTDSTVMPSTDSKTTGTTTKKTVQPTTSSRRTPGPAFPKPEDHSKPQQREVLDDEDPHDAYLRFVGVFLMTLGRGGLTTDMFENIDAIFPSEVFNIEGPVRAALGASKAARGKVDAEFLNMVERMEKTDDEDMGSEWGSAWDHLLYAMGYIRDDDKVAQLEEYIVYEKKITRRNLLWWFRGCNEGRGHGQLAFLTRYARTLADRFPPDCEEYYQCLRQYCLFDHTDRAWDIVEHLVAQCPALARRLNVPDYRRRSQYLTALYDDYGEPEIVAWISHPGRAVEIHEAAFIPKSVAAAQRNGNPAPT